VEVMKYRWIHIFIGVLAACNNSKEEPNGGPCTYQSEYYPAKLIILEKVDSAFFDGWFEVPMGPDGSRLDTINFHRQNNQYISAADISSGKVVIDSIYRYNDQFIKTGSCNPHVAMIELEAFRRSD
jgi:hypothetical protein